MLTLENRLLKKTYNMHFHLNFDPLRKNDATVYVKDITINDEFFCQTRPSLDGSTAMHSC